jgi:hypothetical protein
MFEVQYEFSKNPAVYGVMVGDVVQPERPAMTI